MSKKIKTIGIVFSILILIPITVLGGSFTNSLIQGKTPQEAIEIIANQLDSLMGRTVILEEKQGELEDSIDITVSGLEEIKRENEELKLQIEEQKVRVDAQVEQRENDIYCDELSGAGSKFLPVKQPIKELYENLLKQNSVTYEDAYRENVEGDAKVLSESEFKVQWQEGKDSRDNTLAKLKPYYDEFMSKCN